MPRCAAALELSFETRCFASLLRTRARLRLPQAASQSGGSRGGRGRKRRPICAGIFRRLSPCRSAGPRRTREVDAQPAPSSGLVPFVRLKAGFRGRFAAPRDEGSAAIAGSAVTDYRGRAAGNSAPRARGAHPQRTRPQRSRQHQLQRRFPQRSRQQFRHLTRSRSPLAPLITLFDRGTMDMADPVVEAVASSSPANPIASAIFDMRKSPWRALSQ